MRVFPVGSFCTGERGLILAGYGAVGTRLTAAARKASFGMPFAKIAREAKHLCLFSDHGGCPGERLEDPVA